MSKLLNLTGAAIHVLLDGELVKLEELPPPTVVTGGLKPTGVLDFAHESSGFTLETEEDCATFTIGLPPAEPGVFLLVDVETLYRLPQRKDLLSPAAYTLHGELGDQDNAEGSLPVYLSQVFSSTRAPEGDVPDLDPASNE